MKKLASLLLILVLTYCLTTSFLRADEPIKIIDLRGDGAAMGKAHGQALGAQMHELYEKYLNRLFRDDKIRKQALIASFVFRNQLSKEHQAEISALAGAAGIDAGQVMLGNCFLDLSPMTACSTITLSAKASPDGVARFGRNLDFPSFNIADKSSVVLVFHSKDRYAFAAVSWPGLIGVLSGMNEHGLTLANMEVSRPMGMPHAMPYIILYRTILERCKTVPEAIALLEKTDRQTPNNLMLMDASGERAVVEITPEKITVRRAPDDRPLISTNHHRGEDLDQKGLCRRYDYLHDQALTEFGHITPESIEKMLANVAQGDMTLQSMIFEPSTRTMYLATGSEATKHTYQKIDLAERFRN